MQDLSSKIVSRILALFKGIAAASLLIVVTIGLAQIRGVDLSGAQATTLHFATLKAPGIAFTPDTVIIVCGILGISFFASIFTQRAERYRAIRQICQETEGAQRIVVAHGLGIRFATRSRARAEASTAAISVRQSIQRLTSARRRLLGNLSRLRFYDWLRERERSRISNRLVALCSDYLWERAEELSRLANGLELAPPPKLHREHLEQIYRNEEPDAGGEKQHTATEHQKHPDHAHPTNYATSYVTTWNRMIESEERNEKRR